MTKIVCEFDAKGEEEYYAWNLWGDIYTEGELN
jgi:hypothetical protein